MCFHQCAALKTVYYTLQGLGSLRCKYSARNVSTPERKYQNLPSNIKNIIMNEVFSLWLYSPLDSGRFFIFLILYIISKTPWTGDQPVTRPLLTHRINAHRHPCLEWDSNSRSKYLSGRRHFRPVSSVQKDSNRRYFKTNPWIEYTDQRGFKYVSLD
jgi:hypothetical protein